MIRIPSEEYREPFLHPGRKRFILFLVLAGWVHFLAFLGWERIGFEYLGDLPGEDDSQRLVELTLELNPQALAPPAPPRSLEPPPESTANTAPPPEPIKEEAPPDLLENVLDQPLTAAPPSPEPPTETEPVTPDPSPPASVDPNPVLDGGASLWPEGAEPQTFAPVNPGPDNTVKLEETAPRLKSYNITVRGAVAQRWILPPEARNNFQPGRFTAVMTLDKEGRIVLITVEESSGSPSLDYAAMEALRGAAPYEPFPAELAHNEQLSFRLHFDYRAVYRPAGP
ncbi:MAG: TonB family protein [Deltaproteobacteria bacterium]|nr:TonB family protein [Deltaproteobacteria bacterium]